MAFTQLRASDREGLEHRTLEVLTQVNHGINNAAADNQQEELQIALLKAGSPGIGILPRSDWRLDDSSPRDDRITLRYDIFLS